MSLKTLLRKAMEEPAATPPLETKQISYIEVNKFKFEQGYQLYKLLPAYQQLAAVYPTWNELHVALYSINASIDVDTYSIMIGNVVIGKFTIL